MSLIPNDENEGFPSDTIRMRIGEARKLDRQIVTSSSKIIDGFNWEVNVDVDHNNYVDIGLFCFSSSYSPWFCCATAHVKLTNFKNDSLSMYKTFRGRCNEDEDDLGGPLIDFAVLMKERSNFVRDNSILIEVTIEVIRSGCSEVPIDSCDFSSPSRLTDVILIVEGKKLHVSKHILAHHSSFFEALFFGEFKEANQSEVKIEDVAVQEMLIVLNIVYGNENIQDKSIDVVLKLADRFGMQKLVSDASSFLLKSDGVKLLQKIFLAERYQLPFVLDDCMQKLDSREKIRDLKNEKEFGLLSVSLRDELLDKALKFS
ncbi:hypothetical protein PFISCL1PPCAC_28467 [Pristionchus fissidentatus]|uniref:BTB domain-containing protein n=1 Tax=Pristionchus fissidentatus TaxID=1538716 RepID=A0AAV5X2E6_9BILA|nr:hypothetical protein PFISCL1PPCAC_28467 [Pristionchus fissidentatus]